MLTRRDALGAIGRLAATPAASASALNLAYSEAGMAMADGAMPQAGRLLPGLEFLDEIIPMVMANHGYPGVTVAIAKDGKLKAARGYGMANVESGQPMQATSLMCLASVSKVMTAQTILQLVGNGQLALSDRAFDFFPDMPVVPGMQEDPRLRDITVQMLLHHSGGWDRNTSGDPNGWGPRVRRALRLNHPPGVLELVRYMKGVPLDFTPGTATVYSNFGFALLGAIIAKVTGQEYGAAVQGLMLRPMGVERMRLDALRPAYVDGEAHRYVAGSDYSLPGGQDAMIMPAGGWISDAVQMAWIMSEISGARTGTPFQRPEMVRAMLSPPPGLPPRSNGTYFGMGWDEVKAPADGGGGDPLAGFEYGKDGGLSGISTWVQHLANGVDWALLVNASAAAHGEPTPESMLTRRIIPRLRSVAAWPAGDLFGQHPGDIVAA